MTNAPLVWLTTTFLVMAACTAKDTVLSSDSGSGGEGATGGSATGGSATGGSATGGSATGGSATGGHAGGTGGSTGTGGSGGSGGLGTGGAGTGGTSGAVDAGRDAPSCGLGECFRAVSCVRACGSAPETVSCCACVAPAFDDIACADSGTPTISYLGCTYVGGVDRYVVGKRDSARNLCFNLVLSDPGTTKAGLTLPSRLGLESASVGPAATCPARTRGSVVASQVTGTVTGSPGTGGLPTSFGVDVTLTFPADAAAPMTERLVVDAVDLQAPCKN